MEAAGKLLGLFVCLVVLLSFLGVFQLPLVSSSNVPQTPPTIQDFWVSSTWAGRPSQFAFNLTDSTALVNATLQTNCTGSNSNSTLSLSGASAWANYTLTLPSSNAVVAFQFWVWNSNSSIFATTGLRYISVYNYANGTATPLAFDSLTNAITAVQAANNWNLLTEPASADYDPYVMAILDKASISTLSAMIDNYAAEADWRDVLKWSAICNKLNVTMQTDINWALGNYTMAGSLPSTGTNADHIFEPENKWALYGFYYANQDWASAYNSSITSKWNITAAYQQFNSSIYYCINSQNGLPLWVYAGGTSETYSNRYYDEDASSIECYLLFYSLLNVTDALTQALNCWNLVQTWHWNSSGGFYSYADSSPNNVFECEAGFFLKIISELKYYCRSLANWTNVLTDLETKFLSSEWNSLLWSYYVCVHANTNPQLRLVNTIGAWQALLGAFSQLSPAYQSNMADMLYGNSNTGQAWRLLLAGGASGNTLFDPTTNLFRAQTTGATWGYEATAWGEFLLFLMGIVPGSTTTAFPLEELNYEYTQDVDLQIMQFCSNTTTRYADVPLATAGTLTFQYGVSPITCNFTSAGVWQISFSPSWNTITNVSYVSALPTNMIYFSQAVAPPILNPPVANFTWSPIAPTTGETVTFDASSSLPGLNGTQGMPIVSYSWDYGDNNTATGQIVTHTYSSVGNFTVTLNVTDAENLTDSTSQTLTVYVPITFDQSGVGSDFNGTVLNVDGSNYGVGDLPKTFLWNVGSNHSFDYASPLVTSTGTTQYAWTSTTGLSENQSGTITVPSSGGSFTGYYKTQYSITFAQSGLGLDFNDTVVVIDGSNFNVSALPASFWYDNGSAHSFAFQLPLFVGPDAKPYVWNSSNGLSTLQSDSIIVSSSGSVTGNYLSLWPTANFGWSPHLPTGNETVTFDASSSLPGLNGTQTMPIVLYSWDFGDGNTTMTDTPIITYPYASPGTYNVTLSVTDSEGFTDSTSQTLTVYLQVSVSPGSVMLSFGQSQPFTSTVLFGTYPYAYQWYLNDTPVSGATDSNWTFAPTSPGSYAIYVNVTDSLGAQGTSDSATVTVIIRDVAVTGAAFSKTVVGRGYGVNVTVTATDLGQSAETFNVTIYGNTTVISSQNVTLASGNSTTITFVWDTTGSDYGNYALSAYAWPVANETDTANNNCTGGWTIVSIVGDVSGPNGRPDGRVDMKDIAVVARCFGSKPGSGNWNANADLNGDGAVNMRDIALVARNFGQHL